jgi:hypothetical protein
MPRETIAGRKSFNIVCSPVLLYRVPLVVIPASGPLQENENALRKGQLQVLDGLDLGPAWFVLRPVVAASVA